MKRIIYTLFLISLFFIGTNNALSLTRGPRIEGEKIDDQWSPPKCYDSYLDAVQDDKGLWGFYLPNGKKVRGHMYEKIGQPGTCYIIARAKNYYSSTTYKYTTIPVMKNGKWGLVDIYGKEIVKPKYDSISPLKSKIYENGRDSYGRDLYSSNKYAEVELKGQKYFIETGGLEVNPKGWDVYQIEDLAFFLVERKDIRERQPVILSSSNKWKVNFQSPEGPIFLGNNYDDGSRYIFCPSIDKALPVVIWPNWVRIDENMIARVDKKGNPLPGTLMVEDVYEMSNGQIRILRNGKYGLMDRSGGIIIEPKYKELNDQDVFYTAVDAVSGHVVIIDNKTGEELLSGLDSFWKIVQNYNGNWIAAVKKEGKWGLIDSNYKFVLDPVYSQISHLNKVSSRGADQYLTVSKEGKSGKALIRLMSGTSVKEVVPFGIFDEYVNVYESDFVMGMKNKSYGAFCRKGAIIKPGQGTKYTQEGNAIFFEAPGGLINAYDTQGNFLGSARLTTHAQMRQFYNTTSRKAR